MENSRKRKLVKEQESPKKKHKYNLRKKSVDTEEDVRWVDDDLSSDEDDSTYVSEESEESEEVSLVDEEEEEEDTKVHGITVPAKIPVSVKIHLHAFVDETDEEDEEEFFDEEEEDEEEEEEEDIDDPFLLMLLDKYGEKRSRRSDRPFLIIPDDEEKKKKKSKKDEIEPALKLNRTERSYFDELSKKKQKEYQKKMTAVSKLLSDQDVPFKFKILELPIPEPVKASVIKKVDMIQRMGDSGEAHKMRTWVDAFLRVPFGKQIPLPVSILDGTPACSKFLSDTRQTLDSAVYGMHAAKTQIMQVLAQWIANPTSVGNVIALKGPMGVGKTSFARNGIATVLKRPFSFFSLGGASDISHFIGHSYTYEGSTWGRVIDSLMQARCMNPVFYFDELDKISETPHGEEITSLLIHLTDRSQNMQFHDRYFAGVDFDLSQCLFVFSFNDESKVHPILKDRMNVIQCSGYSEEEKKIILTQYIWPDMLKRFKLESTDIVLSDEAIRYMIREFSTGEEGVRSVIRVVETLVMRINLLRIAAKDDPATKAYKFYMDITFPLTVTTAIAEKLLTDVTPSTLKNGVPFGMYA